MCFEILMNVSFKLLHKNLHFFKENDLNDFSQYPSAPFNSEMLKYVEYNSISTEYRKWKKINKNLKTLLYFNNVCHLSKIKSLNRLFLLIFVIQSEL